MSYPNRWLGVEVRHLVAFEAVTATGSFSGAARELGYTQSAVSLQIAQLERLAGSRLIERRGGRHPVTLTRAGQQLVRHAGLVLDRVRAAQADLAALAAGEVGTLAIGTFQSASARLLPGALRRMRETHPLVEVRLHDAPYDQQLGLLATYQTDLAFVLLPIDGPYETRELLSDPFVLVAAARPPRPRSELPALAELARLPFISWQRGPFFVERVLRDLGHEPRVVLRSDDRATVQNMVAEGLGVAVLPRLALHLPDPRLALTDASRHIPPRRIGLAWQHDRELTPIMLALIQAIEKQAAAVARSGVSAISGGDGQALIHDAF